MSQGAQRKCLFFLVGSEMQFNGFLWIGYAWIKMGNLYLSHSKSESS